SNEPDPWLALRYYEIRLLDHLGFRPQLFTCANCRAEIQPVSQYFSASHGGVLCPKCGAGLPGVWEVSLEALKYLRHFQRSTYREAKRARPLAAIQNEVESLMQCNFTYLLERELNTPGFIKQIKKYESV
ncbi:MAG: DNA repair protein RecO C-terminal domain-containing protein, partial [Anaerolineales bacterium]|nr:DNA repair protein RecO C-terminal domain-containing protein [Anaerolineales bacterium]